jgi:hypothetical protein
MQPSKSVPNELPRRIVFLLGSVPMAPSLRCVPSATNPENPWNNRGAEMNFFRPVGDIVDFLDHPLAAEFGGRGA